MGGLAPLPPLYIMDYVDRRMLPVSHDEALSVICAMDDLWRELNAPAQK